MTIEDLYKKLKNIYGEDCLKRHYEKSNMELLSNILYQLDYDDDDYRNMMAIDEVGSEFFLTDLGESSIKFSQKTWFESWPTIKNLMKKYSVVFSNGAFFKKIDSENIEDIKQIVSDYMCFIFSTWFFALHQSMYAYPVLSRGYFYREEYENEVVFNNEEFFDVIKKCKDTYSDFAYDKNERLFYRFVEGKKKYLVKLFDGYTFNDLIPDKEEDISSFGEGITDFTKEEIINKIKKVAGDKFDPNDLSYTTYICENGIPFKFYLKSEDNKYFFTDKGNAKKKYKKECTQNEFAALIDCSSSKNFDARVYIENTYLKNDEAFAKFLDEKINLLALTTKDINEVDFSRIGKFETQLNSFENIREIILEKAKCEVVDEENKCTFITPYEYENDEKVCFSLERGEEFSYFTFDNKYEGETLEKLLMFLKDKDIVFDKEENKFKIFVYENHEGIVIRKAHKMLELIIFYTNANKFFRTGYTRRTEEERPSTYEDVCKKLKEIKNFGPFFGFYESSYKWTKESEETKVLFVFGQYFYHPSITKSANVEIRKEGDKYCVRNERLEKALANANANEYLLNLVENFNLNNRTITNDSLKMKLSNMVQLVICAQIAKLI